MSDEEQGPICRNHHFIVGGTCMGPDGWTYPVIVYKDEMSEHAKDFLRQMEATRHVQDVMRDLADK